MDIPVYLDLEDDCMPSNNNNNKMAFDPLLPHSPRTGKKEDFCLILSLYFFLLICWGGFDTFFIV